MTACPVCFALTYDEFLEDHLRWHKNLSNIPPKESTDGPR